MTDLQVVYLGAVVEEPVEAVGVQLVAVAGCVEAGLEAGQFGPGTEVRPGLQGCSLAASLNAAPLGQQVVVCVTLHAEGRLDGVREGEGLYLAREIVHRLVHREETLHVLG